MRQNLPEYANLEYLKKQAKQLLREHQEGATRCLELIRTLHPNWHRTPLHAIAHGAFALRDAQLVTARGYGFASWTELSDAVKRGSEDPVKQLAAAIDDDDGDRMRSVLSDNPDIVHRDFIRVSSRHPNGALTYAADLGSIKAVRMLIEAGADIHEHDDFAMGRAMGHGDTAMMDFLLEQGVEVDLADGAHLMGPCEGHGFATIKWLLDRGMDPNYHDEDWGCTALMALLQTYTRSNPDELHECIDAMIAAGADFEDGPVMDLHRGRHDKLVSRIEAEPTLVNRRFDLNYGNHLPLRGATLLHVAAEYGEVACADLLLQYGADIDAKAGIHDGVGGQTPIYHAIGSNQGSCYSMFEHLIGKNPRLDSKALIRLEKEGEILELTPLGYALQYEKGPDWREASREVKHLQQLGALR